MINNVKLVFSDESGNLEKDDYYVRVGLILDALKYADFTEKFNELKNKFKIPLDKEFKYSYLWFLHKKANISKDKVYSFFKNRKYKVKTLKTFIKKSVLLLNSFNPMIVLIFTYVYSKPPKEQVKIESDFLRALMLRLESELSETHSLGIIFYDELSKQNILLSAYNYLFENDQLPILGYNHIKDSLSFDVSTYSSGIQLADYIAGITRGCLKKYHFSKNLFKKVISKWVRRKSGYTVMQTGFVPFYFGEIKDKKIKKEISKKLMNLERLFKD
ncbi:DUF3800 domain-containing protein [Candidatus Woesearchaeota archaeon]|nr:DUF3800 domain-containing protein [Candidatus Woesearchaeota archaeon]